MTTTSASAQQLGPSVSAPTVTLDDFLAAFFPDVNEPIHFRAFKTKDAPESTESRPRMMNYSRGDLARPGGGELSLQEANVNCGVYFAPNSGGTKDADIVRFNAVFVENDSSSIEDQHAALDSSPLPPSVRVVTKRSVHAYWLLSDGCTAEQWRKVQNALIGHFDGDPAIKNP